ncbi:MAG: CDP-alcohol phosphatidyltransferase family protein [Deltaproteobacteria bacterium]|nr:CDP-alcohol phosphatidyltransferase family protein [Deltaproteobacteria bacterium]
MLDSLLGRAGAASATRLDALAQTLVHAGCSAGALTHTALASGVGAGLLFYTGHSYAAFLSLSLSGLLDALDGRVARLGAGPTAWGGVLDLTYDRIVEAVVLLGVALPHPERHAAGLVLAASWYVNLCVFMAVGAASARHSEKLIHYPPGILERTEALLFALLVVLWPGYTPAILSTYAGLGFVTAAQRFAYGRATLRKSR